MNIKQIDIHHSPFTNICHQTIINKKYPFRIQRKKRRPNLESCSQLTQAYNYLTGDRDNFLIFILYQLNSRDIIFLLSESQKKNHFFSPCLCRSDKLQLQRFLGFYERSKIRCDDGNSLPSILDMLKSTEVEFVPLNDRFSYYLKKYH